MQYDVIIIGGGIAGLSAGALLSKDGYSVLILEKNKNIGGRVQILEKEGYLLDWGIHFVRFGKYSRCAEVLRKIGKEHNFLIPSKLLLYKDNEFYQFPILSRESKLKLLRYFMTFPFKSIKRFFYDVPVSKVLMSLNLKEDLKEMIRLFLFVSLVCPDAEKASAREIRKFLKTLFKTKGVTVGYPEGGWQKILDILKDEIVINGKILTETKVNKILIENNKVVKIITNNDEFLAKIYILTIPLQEISEIVDISLLSQELQNYSKKLEPTSGITLYFGLNKKISEIKSIIITPEPLSMGCFISNIEPKLAPFGKQLGTWFCLFTPEEIKDENIKEKKIKELKILLEKMFPGLWNISEWERIIIHEIVDGAIPKVGQSYRERANFSCNIKNLFFAGDTTRGFGWGSEISFDSAIKCRELVKKYLKKEG